MALIQKILCIDIMMMLMIATDMLASDEFGNNTEKASESHETVGESDLQTLVTWTLGTYKPWESSFVCVWN